MVKDILFVGHTMELRGQATKHITQICGESVSLALGSIDDEKDEASWRRGRSDSYHGAIVQLFDGKPGMPWGLIRILALKEAGIPVVGYVLTEDDLPMEMYQFVKALEATSGIPIKVFSIEMTPRGFGVLVKELEALLKPASV